MFCSNAAPWKYRLEQDHTWATWDPVCEIYASFDRKGRLRLLIDEKGVITIFRGYSWDGCSPKFCFFDFLIGTPDGVVYEPTGKPKAYYASLIHDVLYQFLGKNMPYSRRTVDGYFLRLLAESEFRPRWIYWLAVRLLGGVTKWIKKWKRGWRSSNWESGELVEQWEVDLAKRQAEESQAPG